MCDAVIDWRSTVPPFHGTTQTIKVEAAISSEILILPINEVSGAPQILYFNILY